MPSKWMKWLVRLSFSGAVLAIQSWKCVIFKNPVEPPLSGVHLTAVPILGSSLPQRSVQLREVSMLEHLFS